MGGRDRERFTVDSKTGELAFKRAPDFEKPADEDKDNNYEVEVQVDDRAGGVASKMLHVSVIDANDRPYIAKQGTIHAEEGQLVATTVEARDEDRILQKLKYSLRGGPDRKRLTIDPATGELRFRETPEFENPTDADNDNVYEVEVKVNDGRGGSAVKSIRVKVLDVNETPPGKQPADGRGRRPRS